MHGDKGGGGYPGATINTLRLTMYEDYYVAGWLTFAPAHYNLSGHGDWVKMSAVPGLKPDMVLMMTGGMDVGLGGNASYALDQLERLLVDTNATTGCGQSMEPCGLWAGSPTTHVFLSEVLLPANKPTIPYPWSAETIKQFGLYNKGLSTLTAKLKSSGRPVDFVDMVQQTGLCASRPEECGACPAARPGPRACANAS